jgi:hypothetical protein
MKAPQKSLKNWTKQKWRTKSGKPSGKTGERYLPEAAIKSLSSAEYAETTKAKREGTKAGKQFVKQPKSVAKKTAKFRAAEGGMANKSMNSGMKALKKSAPAVAKKMGYKDGGQAMHRMPDGTMMKGAKHGYKHGGVTKKKVGMKDGGMANCGASMKPNRMSRS